MKIQLPNPILYLVEMLKGSSLSLELSTRVGIEPEWHISSIQILNFIVFLAS